MTDNLRTMPRDRNTSFDVGAIAPALHEARAALAKHRSEKPYRPDNLYEAGVRSVADRDWIIARRRAWERYERELVADVKRAERRAAR